MQLFIFHFSFITFPQILFDGFQADNTNVNQSLPNFEFINILTADVSNHFTPHPLPTNFLSIFASCASVSFFPFGKHTKILKNFSKKKRKILQFYLSFTACSLRNARNSYGSGKAFPLTAEKKNVVAWIGDKRELWSQSIDLCWSKLASWPIIALCFFVQDSSHITHKPTFIL